MTARFEVSIDGVSGGAAPTHAAPLRVDPASARELELFVSRLPPDADGTVTRPVVAWRGDIRTVIDVTVRRSETGAWQLLLGGARDEGVAPDREFPVDARLEDLSTMVWITDADRLARWFNRAWLDYVGADLAAELGWGWMRHLHDDDVFGLLETYESAQQEVRGFEHTARVADAAGAYAWLRVRATPQLVDGSFAGFVGMCTRVDDAPGPGRRAGSELVDLLPAADERSVAHAIDRLARLDTALELARPADTVEAGLLRRIVAAWVARHEPLRDRDDEVVLAVHEAVTNCVRHAYEDVGRVSLCCELRDGQAEFRIRDWGQWKSPDPAIAHRGILLMDGLADESAIEHLPDGTEVRLRFRT
jgi:anti-sigma regulatory factor (Ser/Thr protein kinase)/PAS domain-containing protein